jgi:2-polyprenyl-3-methyl-5-hydroxy-6-metoxy-1,4-benzoquinol methylase
LTNQDASADWAASTRAGDRFAFGRNWARFLALLDESRIAAARSSLQELLQIETLEGKRLLDAGSGSGLFSLAARQLGATVHSFDFDPQSVACTRELQRRFFKGDPCWSIDEASVLDVGYLQGLGEFDVVYSWGVLHHTGSMYAALSNIAPLVKPSGQLSVAIYNDQGWISRYWKFVKRLYNRNPLYKALLIAFHAPYLVGLRYAVRLATGRRKLERGMAIWTDALDWLGGYPFEVATPEQIFRFFRDRGFDLTELRTCRGRMGCNEFVFRRRQVD